MLAILIPLFPNASKEFAPAIIILALVSIIYAALIAIAQKDMKRTFAYISISHFGFIVMGIFSFTSIGIIGSTVYMVAHGLSTAALFLTAGYLMRQKDTSLINNFGGLTKTAPLLTGFFLVASLSSIALPGLAGFVGEFMVLTGTYQRNQIVAVIATLGIILAAIYMLWLYQRVFTGPENDGTKNVSDLNTKQSLILTPVVVLTILFGLFPSPVIKVSETAVANTLKVLKVNDPAPRIEMAKQND
jgi:NADH-quinone oxidoreductase subunit M